MVKLPSPRRRTAKVPERRVTPDRGPAILLREVARLHVRAQRQVMLRANINLSHCTVLTELTQCPELSVLELAARLRVDKGWVSRIVQQMVRDSLLHLRTNSSDARSVLLSATAKGRRLHDRIEGLLNAQVDRVIARMPPAKTSALNRALPNLFEAYQSELS